MLSIVKTLSTRIKDQLRRIKVQRLGKNDIQEPYESMPHGLDSNPVKDMQAIYAKTGVRGEEVIIGYINKNRMAKVGATRLYSTNANGEERNYILLDNDGVIEIGGNADNIIRYSQMKLAFDQLKTEFNAAVAVWNSFATAYVPGSPTLQGTPPVAPQMAASVADMSSAKVDEVKTSGVIQTP